MHAWGFNPSSNRSKPYVITVKPRGLDDKLSFTAYSIHGALLLYIWNFFFFKYKQLYYFKIHKIVFKNKSLFKKIKLFLFLKSFNYLIYFNVF